MNTNIPEHFVPPLIDLAAIPGGSISGLKLNLVNNLAQHQQNRRVNNPDKIVRNVIDTFLPDEISYIETGPESLIGSTETGPETLDELLQLNLINIDELELPELPHSEMNAEEVSLTSASAQSQMVQRAKKLNN